MPQPLSLHREPDGTGGPDAWRRPEGGGGGSPSPQRDGSPPHEPAIRAPWPALLLAAACPLGYALQHLGGPPLAAADRLGFRPSLLAEGGWTGLLTALFVHAGWTHAWLNGLAALAFGAPVSRRLGTRPTGAAQFLLFFVACGVVGSLGFALPHLHDPSVLVGASGGIAGLMGAASRMTPPVGAGLLPLNSRPVLIMAGSWIAVNAVFALVGLDLGTSGAPLAWEAHLAGYAAGLFAIGPVLRWTNARA